METSVRRRTLGGARSNHCRLRSLGFLSSPRLPSRRRGRGGLVRVRRRLRARLWFRHAYPQAHRQGEEIQHPGEHLSRHGPLASDLLQPCALPLAYCLDIGEYLVESRTKINNVLADLNLQLHGVLLSWMEESI